MAYMLCLLEAKVFGFQTIAMEEFCLQRLNNIFIHGLPKTMVVQARGLAVFNKITGQASRDRLFIPVVHVVNFLLQEPVGSEIISVAVSLAIESEVILEPMRFDAGACFDLKKEYAKCEYTWIRMDAHKSVNVFWRLRHVEVRREPRPRKIQFTSF
jgi:hypothetical protein